MSMITIEELKKKVQNRGFIAIEVEKSNADGLILDG